MIIQKPKTIGEISYNLNDTFLSIGFPSIEEMRYLRANEPDLVVIGARPSAGKTALLCQLAYNLSLIDPVYMFSLEMGAEQLRKRLLTTVSEIPMRTLKFSPPEVLTKIDKVINKSKMYVNDTNGITINELMDKVLTEHARSPLTAVFIDYLQIISVPSGKYGTKAEEVNFIARSLKQLAKDIQRPVIVAAQMNRNIEGRLSGSKDKGNVYPVMSDLADSAGIEKWADVILFLTRDFKNNLPDLNNVTAWAAKNRHGQVKDFKLYFKGEIMKFYDEGFKDDESI